MAGRRVVWTKTALRAFYDQVFWYRMNMGEQFVRTFVRNIQETVEKITAMPSMGRLEAELKKSERPCRSLLSHPKCRIYYWYTEKEVHIIRLRFMRMA